MLFHRETLGEKVIRNVREHMPFSGNGDGVARRVGEYLPDVDEYLPDVSGYAPDVTDAEMARGLGWASIAIGVAEIAAPKQVQDLLGLEDTPDRRGTLRVLGVREICHGVSILTETRPNERMATGVLSRVAGDMLDNVLLGVAATKTNKPFGFAAVAASVLAIGLMDLMTAKRLTKRL